MRLIAWLADTFEIARSGHRTLRSMEGLRGFAVLLVFLVHYTTLVEPLLGRATFEIELGAALRTIGNAGVDLFFVLSGYLIYGLLIRKPTPFWRYLRRRAQRIYPTFLAVFALYLVLAWLWPAENKIPAGVGNAAVYLLQNLLLLPGMVAIEPLITVAWSLSYEFFYYLLVPLVIALSAMRRWQPRQRITFLVFASATGFIVAGIYGSYVRLLMFVAGMLLYELIALQTRPPPAFSGLFALVVSVVALPALKQLGVLGVWRYVLLYLAFLLLCWECFASGGVAARLFSWAPLRWYGNMSYSYYLIHGLTLKGAFLVFAALFPFSEWRGLFWLLAAPMFLISLLPAALLFIWVEKPLSLATRHSAAVAPDKKAPAE